MAGNDFTATVQALPSLLHLVRDVARISATGFKDCADLYRRVALLSYLLEEIWEYEGDNRRLHKACFSSSFRFSISELTAALEAAIRLLQSAGDSDHIISTEKAAVEFKSQFRSVTCKLETALSNFPYGDFDISQDVKELVDFVRCQSIRAAQRYETINIHHHGVESKVRDVTDENLPLKAIDAVEDPVIPVDLLCPISGELFRDPVIVSTGQTYERSYIQIWIDSGSRMCPKTGQKLKNLNLTPNYVLRSLIAQWCTDHNVNPPTLPENKRAKKIKAVVIKRSSQSIEEQRPTKFEDVLLFMAIGASISLLLIFITYACPFYQVFV
ncbi:hypothetical protein L1887_30698 [Cichorium endivia]|nr:hypothetical protein L1887_30698 [Cichorium endivia]